MKDGFIRVAAATPDLKVADPVFNREQTWTSVDEGRKTLQRSGCHQGWRAFRPCSEETSSELF